MSTEDEATTAAWLAQGLGYTSYSLAASSSSSVSSASSSSSSSSASLSSSSSAPSLPPRVIPTSTSAALPSISSTFGDLVGGETLPESPRARKDQVSKVVLHPGAGADSGAEKAQAGKGRSVTQQRKGRKNPCRPRRWSKAEDTVLKALVNQLKAKEWKKVSAGMRDAGFNRSEIQCLHRYNKCLKEGLIKGPWTKEEDSKLLQLIISTLVKLLVLSGRMMWSVQCDPNARALRSR